MTDTLTQYNGACHCGAIQFQFQSAPITGALQCNCSICIRKNAIMTTDYVAPENFTLIQGENNLALYHWGDNDVNHWFCKTCGIYPFHDIIYEPGKYRVNLGCIEDIAPRLLQIRQFDGKHLL